MNLALLGHGAMGTEHLEVLVELGGVVPHVVAGLDAEAVNAFAHRYGFKRAVTDVIAAVTDPQVDVVIIASPNHEHAPQARAAIEAGKHVLIEIPIALNLADAEDLGRLARASSATVMAGHTSRYYPTIRQLVGRIRAGELHPHHIVSMMGTDKRWNRNWKGEERGWVDDLLWHHGLHVFDTILHLFGDDAVESAALHRGRRHPDHGGDMEVSVSLQFADDRLATIALTYHAQDQFTRYAVIAEEAFIDYEQGRDLPEGHDLMGGGTFRDLVRHQDRDFLDACRRGEPAPVPIDEILPAMRLLGRLQAQLEERRPARTPAPE